MRGRRTALLVTAIVAVGACGGGAERDAAPSGRSVVALPGPSIERPVEAAPEARPATPVAAPRQAGSTLEQPAIWPAADVVFATPEEAAADFVRAVLTGGDDPTLGDFVAGDSRSGEIAVFSPGDGPGATPLQHGTLLMRQLGPDDGWFVIGAVSDGATITTPETGAEVPAAMLTVEGEARGFEGTVLVFAFSAGDRSTEFDLEIVRGGPFEELEPYSTALDLSDTMPGEIVAVMVLGDSGLDFGDFAAVPIVIEDAIPPTR